MEGQSDWKAFENNEVSHSVAHYLMAIDELIDDKQCCRAADVARQLDISRNAVSLKLQTMIKQDFVALDKERQIHLTDKGMMTVENILSTRRSFHHFLTDVLGIESDVAEEDSCKVEHLLSEETRTKLLKLNKFLQSKKPECDRFIKAFNQYDLTCNHQDQDVCEICHHRCIID